MKWKIDDVPIFIAVVDHASVSAAAKALGMPKSTVSTAISRLEHGLGLRLINRNTRNLHITEEGDTFYRQAQLILEQVLEADAAMAGQRATPSGRLTVALPPAFCQEIVAPNLTEFQQAYPDIELDIISTSHATDLIRDQVDVAVAVGSLDDSDLISKTLVGGRLVWVATPTYADHLETDSDLDALLSHVRICETRYGQTRIPIHVRGKAAQIDLQHGISHVSDPLVVRRVVLDGGGVSLLPWHYCRNQIEDGTLVEVYPHITFDVSASKLTVVFPSRRNISPRVRVFVDFLEQICAHIQ